MIYLLISTICFSLSFGLIKAQLAELPTVFVVFVRLLIACLIFLPFIKKLTCKEHLKAMLFGVIQFGVMYLCFVHAFKFLQGNEIALLTTTTPIFVSIWSIFFGEKFKLVSIFCILFSVLGAIIIVWQNTTFNMLIKGILLMETSNCSFALGQVLWKKYIKGNSIDLMSSAYLGAVIFVFPFMIFNVQSVSVVLTPLQILSLLYLAVIPTGIGFWLWNKGTGQVNASVLAIMNNLKIPVGILFAIFMFHEHINLTNFIFGCLIILFAFLLQLKLKL